MKMIKNTEILNRIALIKVDNKNTLISKYLNFLILDDCLMLSEYIQDKVEKLETLDILKNNIKQNIYILQKDKNDIKNLVLNKEYLHFLDQNIFDLFEYKFNQIKKNKANYFKSYLQNIDLELVDIND